MSPKQKKDGEKRTSIFKSISSLIQSAQVPRKTPEASMRIKKTIDITDNLCLSVPIIKNKTSKSSKEKNEKFLASSVTESTNNMNEFKLMKHNSTLSLMNLPVTDTSFKGSPIQRSLEDPEKRWWRRSFQAAKPPAVLGTATATWYLPKDDNCIWETTDLKKYSNLQIKDLSDNTAKTKTSSKHIKRLQIILEFFHNEVAFIEVLCTIGKHFYDPFKEQNILSECNFNLLFPNLMEFIDIHKTFVHTLIVCIQNKTIGSQFADVLHNQFKGFLHVKYKDVWDLFFEKNVIGREILRRLRIKDIKVKQFMNALENDPRLNKCGFNDLISRIHKHLAEYPLYIGRLIENTPPNKPDHNLLKSALEGCKLLLESINARIQAAQTYQIMYEKQNIIKKTIKSDKFLTLLPQKFDLLTQSFIKFGCLNVYSKNRTVYECDALITSKAFIFFRKSDTEYFLKPINMFSLDSTYKVSTFIISVSSIVRVYEDEPNLNKFSILAKESNGKEFICRVEADCKQNQQDWIASITKAMNFDEKEEPFALLYTSPTDLSNSASADKLSINEGMSINSSQTLNTNTEKTSPIIASEWDKLESIKIKNQEDNRKLVESVLGKPKFKAIEENDIKQNTWKTCHKKMRELIENVTKSETDKKSGNNVDLITDLIQNLNNYLAIEKASLEEKMRKRIQSLNSPLIFRNPAIKNKSNLQSKLTFLNSSNEKIKLSDTLFTNFKQTIPISEDFKEAIPISEDFKEDIPISEDFKEDIPICEDFNGQTSH